MRRTAVLISGNGSNLQALIDATTRGETGADLSLVIANKTDAFGLVRASRAGIPTKVIDHKRYAHRAQFDQAIDAMLQEFDIELVCLAGFMRILGDAVTDRWQGRMVNVHPSLLPSFKGMNTHERALAAGVRIHGCTVHQVTAELDDGPILVQGAVPVLDNDDVASLAARVLEVEHQCYPLALAHLTGRSIAPRLVLHPDLHTGQGE
ncbi:MAG: phosphoribosylglycinamide formyltransferase [Geminicoccaceae bacterium]|nr:phosphoribosylglycinamide formyltransferase [Geminicoccaceae bacterium]